MLNLFRCSIIFLAIFGTLVVRTVQQVPCDGSVTTKMHSFLYAKSQAGLPVTSFSNMTLEECGKACLADQSCLMVYYYNYKCYSATECRLCVADRWLPGESLIKISQNASNCQYSFPQILSQSIRTPSYNNQGVYTGEVYFELRDTELVYMKDWLKM